MLTRKSETDVLRGPGPAPQHGRSAVGLHGCPSSGQTKSAQKIEDLMELVKKLQKVGSLEPRVEVLINRINEVQQVSGEKVRMKEILSKKQETLRILRLHCQEKEGEAQRKQTMLQECKERISSLNSQIEEEKNKQRQLRLNFEEQLEDLMGQHKDLWEFHRPEHLAREIGALDSSKEQLLKEEKLVEAKLEDVKHRLCSQFGARGCSAITEGLFLRSQEAAAAVLKEELEKLGVQVPAGAQSMQEEAVGPGEAVSPGCREWRQLTKRPGGGKAEGARGVLRGLSGGKAVPTEAQLRQRPIPSPSESVRRTTQSCSPSRARCPPRQGGPTLPWSLFHGLWQIKTLFQ
uniref:Synaptonemal complex central element protein 1 n=1 Tax=Equus caballus TaxID=9796 RepID=A0A3Q2KUF4_HORSE